MLGIGLLTLLSLPTVLADSAAYAPLAVGCPTSPLTRVATSLSSAEADYLSNRKVVADSTLIAWLAKIIPDLSTANVKLPTLALSVSGGGYRSFLTAAGMIRAMDDRDGDAQLGGLFQSLSYHSASSGGAWLLSSLSAANHPTISTISAMWESTFSVGLLDYIQNEAIPVAEAMFAKHDAGFEASLTDPWGRVLSYQMLAGDDGGIGTTLSSLASTSNFSTHAIPYPIMTAVGVDLDSGACLPAQSIAALYELTPFEFGSWEQGIAAFTPTRYLGTSLSDGLPTTGACTANFDNLGFALGTSSSLFNCFCLSSFAGSNGFDTLIPRLAPLLGNSAPNSPHEYAIYPNPFYQLQSTSPSIAAARTLYLVDAGETSGKSPLLPLLEPLRGVDVIFVVDSADDAGFYPNGSSLVTTADQAHLLGLKSFPLIPDVNTIVAAGLNKRPVMFGCRQKGKSLVVYWANVGYDGYESNQPTLKLQYGVEETRAMIHNGGQVATHAGDTSWPTCLACGIMTKSDAALPKECTTCLAKWCEN